MNLVITFYKVLFTVTMLNFCPVWIFKFMPLRGTNSRCVMW